MKMNKKGVSLITVLLFMLVATIAATATYKWLSSEGHSSAARLQMNEARQAAIAGLDGARAWMAYNGNDAGAVLKQYIDGGKQPILLNSVLKDLPKESQKSSVWLTGVKKEGSSYEVKLMSVGESRNGTKHTEAAILKVNGLYQVKVPATKVVSSIPFSEALYAGTTGGVSLNVSSAIINGNAVMNTDVNVTDHLIVTGDLNGNSNSHIKDLYVQGRMLACTDFNVTGDAYIKENVYLNGVVRFHNLYADGGLDWKGEGAPADAQCQTGIGTQFSASGNVTVNGDLEMPTHIAGGAPGELGSYVVDGNLVVKNGRMLFPSIDIFKANGLYLASHYTANFSGNVFIENGIEGAHFPYNRRAEAVKLGAAGKKVYTGSKPLYKVSDNGPVAGAPEKGKIVYQHWIENKIAADGKYHKDTDATWCETNRAGCTWGGKIPADKMPPKNTYCNSDECAPTFVNTLEMQPDFWQNHKFYGVEEETQTVDEEYSVVEPVIPYECNSWYRCSFYDKLCTQLRDGSWCRNSDLKTRTVTKTRKVEKQVCVSDYPGNKGCVAHPGEKPWHCTCTEYDRYRAEAFVQVNGTYSNTPPDTAHWGAPKMQEYADAIQSPSGSCETDYIPEPILFNKSDLENSEYLHSAENKGACANIYYNNASGWDGNSLWAQNNSYDRWSLLEQCYSVAQAAGELYKDEWLLIKFPGSGNQFASWSNTKLSKKYIIMFTENTSYMVPPTTSDGMVLMYFENGGTLEVKGRAPDSRNMFVYSDGDIQYNTENSNWDGTIFLSGCHKIQSVNNIKIDYNEDLTNTLASIGALCESDGNGSCKTTGGSTSGAPGTSGGSSEVTADGMDVYFIATSPHLTISIESQYKSNESVPSAVNSTRIDSTIIVLPRMVYINQDAVGTLSDYYNVIGLNGAKRVKVPGNMQCPSEIPTGTSKLYDRAAAGAMLKKGNYTCHYNSGNESIPFYVVVSDAMGVNPDVNFADDDGNTEILVNDQVEVKLSSPQGDRQITATILGPSPSNLATGWSYQALGNMALQSDDGSNAIYSVTFTPDGNDLPIIKVSTEQNAAQGDVTFQLIEPCEGCKIGAPFIERVFLNGVINVNREDISSSFCSTDNHAQEFQDEYSVGCEDVVSRPDCGSLLTADQWVTADGMNCVYATKNNSWQCNTGRTIRLQSLLANSNYCQVFVPPVSVTEMSLGQTLTLPASVKRKTATLNLKLVNNKGSGNVIVKYFRPGVTPVGEMTEWSGSPCRDNDCTINLYAGDIVTLEGHDGTDKFNYWICDGTNCNETPGTTIPSKTYQMSLTGDNSIEAHFNDKDMHCIYNDFSETNVWCNSSDVGDCVDRCKTDAHCSISDGQHADANWIVVYPNKKTLLGSLKEFEEPTIEKSTGRIYAPKYLGSSLVGATSVVLGKIQAGYNGTLTALFEVPSVASNNWDQLWNKAVNDGFIFRSNADASKYLSMSIVSKIGTGGYTTYARLCYASAVDNDKNTCVDKPFVASLNDRIPVVVTKLSKVSVSITMNNNMVTANLSYNFGGSDFGSAYADFDLSEFPWGSFVSDDGNQQYVGFKFENPGLFDKILSSSFKIYDFAWKTADPNYAKSCWDTPTVSCSFKASYSGGFVPASEDVTPWIGMSSWFNEKNCEVSYFYNGCDIPSEKFDGSWSIMHFFSSSDACKNDKGYYKWSAKELDSYKRGKLLSENYYFTEEGIHGYAYDGGFVNDASVLVTCSDADGSGSGHQYTARCGEFNVGVIEQCSQSYNELLPNNVSESCSGSDVCNISFGSSMPINARNSKIRVTIDGLNSGSVAIYLVSEGGEMSNEAATISSSGVASFDVNEYVYKNTAFNPQKITGIALVGSGTTSYRVTHVQSACPYAFSMTCNTPTYDARTGKWHVSANVSHPEQSDYCEVTPLGDAYSNGVKPPEVTKTSCAGFAQDWILKNAYGMSTTDEGYVFRVTAYDADGEVITDCETPKKDLPNVTLTCSVSAVEVESGAGIPSFGFTITGCPDEGCEYTITEPDGADPSTSNGVYTALVEGHCPGGDCRSMNTALQPLNAGEYRYDVDVYGKTCDGNGNSFTVKEPEAPVNCVSAVASEVGGMFTATLDRAADWTGSWTIFDNMGHPLSSEIAVSGSSETFSQPIPDAYLSCASGTCNFQAVLKPAGGNECSGTWSVTAPVADVSLSGCPANIPDFDGSFNFTPSVSGCDDGCTWTSTMGSVSPASSYTGGAITLSGITTDGSVTLTVSNSGKSANCTIPVTVKPASVKPAFSCPSGGISVSNQLPSQNVSINLSNVTGCTDGCSWHISGGATASDNLSGTSFNFAHNNGTEFWLKLYNGEDSDQCKVTVSYKQKPTYTCPDDATVTKGTNFAVTPTGVQNCTPGCKYSVKDGSTTVLNRDEFTYTSGKIGDVTESSATTKTYTLTLTNDVGDGESCEFKVTYQDGPSFDGKICLASNSIESGINAGTYQFVHECASNGWWYTCTSGKSFSIGGTTYSCYSGSEQSSWNNSAVLTMTAPASGSTLVIPSGTTITKIGCSGNNGRVPAGCSGTGIESPSDLGGGGGVTPPPGTVAMNNSSREITVACGSSIQVNASCSGNVVLSCSGNFAKTVNGQTADQYNNVNVYGAWQNWNGTVTTSCDSGKSMSCSIYCW